MEILPRETADGDVLALFSEHDDFMLDAMGEDRRYYTRYSGEEKLEKIWLACEGGVPVGCIAFRKKDPETGEIKRLFIRKGYRGRGASKALLRALENHAGEQGCRRLYLDTRTNLEPAVSLYRAAGFRVFFQQGLYVQMEKSLCCEDQHWKERVE